MSAALAARLATLLLAVAAGWAVGRSRLLGDGDLSRPLGQLALYLFIPALLFRTAARVDLAALPWTTLQALFGPVVVVMLAHHAWQARRHRGEPAAPGVLAIAGSFGNTVQVGIPVASALFGEAGLAIHVTLVSLHALVLLSVTTALTEAALARAAADDDGTSHLATVVATVRNTVIHPVVLPVMLGLALNLSGLRLPGPLDEALALLGAGVVPLCLALIGLSLAASGLGGHWRSALAIVGVKLLLQPAVVLVVAHWGLGLSGLPLAVVVMLAALPVGSNAQIFAQRYRCREAEAATAIVVSTVLYAATAPAWLAVLALLDGGAAATIRP